jgi:hypothetical protein
MLTKPLCIKHFNSLSEACCVQAHSYDGEIVFLYNGQKT